MSVCSFADQSHRYDADWSGSYTGGPFKGVLHTTEGSTLPDYRGGSEAPHFTVLPVLSLKRVVIYQHFDTKRPSRALVHPAGVQTNNDDAIQIELVGTCSKTGPGLFWPQAPQWALDGLAQLMRWVEAEHGVPRVSTHRPWLPYPDSYGTKNGQRMTAAEWDNFAGWCGHQHVYGNDHGDPGQLNIAALLAAPVKTTVVKTTSSLAAVATALGLTVAALLGANPTIHDPAAPLPPGTTVTLPATPAPKAPAPKKPSPVTPPRHKVVVTRTEATVRLGSTGTLVRVVQAAVGARVDGDFGPRTEAAVVAFQRAHGLIGDGVVGPVTWAAIRAVKAAPAATRAAVAARPVLRQGAHARAVRTVQAAVGAYVDGVFGPRTRAAVIAFQRRHGLVPDGVVGPRTWAVIG